MATLVFIEWSKFFMKNGSEVVDAKPINENDGSFQRLEVTTDEDVQSSVVPDGAAVAIVTVRNGDAVVKLNAPIGGPALGRLCMDGGPRLIPVKGGDVLHIRGLPAYV